MGVQGEYEVTQWGSQTGLFRFMAGYPDGCGPLPSTGALLVPGASGMCNEVFLWYGTSPDLIGEICREGFGPSRGTGLRFAENVAESDFHTTTEGGTDDPKGTRCLLLARVLL